MTPHPALRLTGLAGAGFMLGAGLTVVAVLATDALVRRARRALIDAGWIA